MKCLNCEIPMLKCTYSSGEIYYRCPQCRSIAESTVTDYSELSVQNNCATEQLKEAKTELELKNKRLAIKNRNTRIRNLCRNLTGTQKALEKRNKELSKAKELIQKLLYEYNYLHLIKSETKAEIEQFLTGW